MQYSRQNLKDLGTPRFEAGVYQAQIINILSGKTKNGMKDMFTFEIEGANGERGNFWMVFGTEYVEDSLTRLIASIEDNGNTVPGIDFDYNRQTQEYLAGKNVFINVVDDTYIPKEGPNAGTEMPTTRIKNFLTKDEYLSRKGVKQQAAQQGNNQSVNEISDDDSPF